MRSLKVLVVCLLVVCFSAVGFAAGPKYGGVWKDALNANVPRLDPVHSVDTSSGEVIYQMFETLVQNGPNGDLQPLLAESWEGNKDASVFTLKLRKGVYFHAETEGGQPTANGGREVTAEDWVWTFNYICSPETNSPRAYFVDCIKGYDAYYDGKTDKLAGVKALDKYTLQFELEKSFAPFMNVLAYNTFVVLPKEDVLKWGEEWNFHPVGTGPFKFEEWSQGDKIVLSRNDNYWAKDEEGNQLPYLDGIEFRIITDFAVQWEEFKVGNIYQCFVDDPYYTQAKAKYPESFYEKPRLGTYYYGMNLEMEPFKDNKPLRKAMNYAVNREALIDLVMNGRAEPAKGVLPQSMFAYNEDLEGYKYNPKKAKELLKDAGYPNGIEVTLQYNNNPRHRRIAEALQAIYSQVGIKLNLKSVEWGTHLDTTSRGEVPFFRLAWVADYNDPDNFLYVLLHSANKGGQGNRAFYHNPKFDMLTERARRETKPELRKKLYHQAEKIAVDDAPWVFIYHEYDHSLVQPYVENYVLPTFGQYSNKFTKVWLNK